MPGLPGPSQNDIPPGATISFGLETVGSAYGWHRRASDRVQTASGHDRAIPSAGSRTVRAASLRAEPWKRRVPRRQKDISPLEMSNRDRSDQGTEHVESRAAHRRIAAG